MNPRDARLVGNGTNFKNSFAPSRRSSAAEVCGVDAEAYPPSRAPLREQNPRCVFTVSA